VSISLAGALGTTSLCIWLLAPRDQRATLVRVAASSPSSTPCLTSNASLRSGPTAGFQVEWEIRDDVVSVLGALIREGWVPITRMTTSIKLLPAQQTNLDLGLAHVRVFRGLTLSYTEQYRTRFVATTSVALCLP
jgi:hypothetical protein